MGEEREHGGMEVGRDWDGSEADERQVQETRRAVIYPGERPRKKQPISYKS